MGPNDPSIYGDPSQYLSDYWTAAGDYASDPSDTMRAARGEIDARLGGGYLDRTIDPYYRGPTGPGVDMSLLSPYLDPASGGRIDESLLSGIAGGAYMDPETNPYLQKFIQQTYEKSLAPQLSAMSKYGVYGGSGDLNLRAQLGGEAAYQAYMPMYQGMQQAATYLTGARESSRQAAINRALEVARYGTGLTEDRYRTERAAELGGMRDVAFMEEQGYQSERDRMNAAINQALAFDANEASRIGMMGDIGAEQLYYDDRARREPWDRLGLYQGAVSGTPPAGQTMTQPVYKNRFGQILGAGLTAASLFTGNPAFAGAGSFMNTGGGGGDVTPWNNPYYGSASPY
jgi:hypothetical protein